MVAGIVTRAPRQQVPTRSPVDAPSRPLAGQVPKLFKIPNNTLF